MATHTSGTGDPARTLQLLWRLPPEKPRKRGPRQALSIDEVVTTAVSIADAEGLDAVTMRQVGHDLGVATMTLYTYVPGKAELLDLMVDHIFQQMPRSDFGRKRWRARVEAVAADNRALFVRHPWAASISTARPPLGPGVMAKYEHELKALEGTGLSDVEMDSALTLVLQFVRLSTLNERESAAAQESSAMSDAQWWAENEPLMKRIVDDEQFPLANRVGSAVGAALGTAFDPTHAYEFGLKRIVDGLAALIERSDADR